MKKIQTSVATVGALLSVLVGAGVSYLVFVFPKTMALWADEGRALSAGEQMLASLSRLCRTFGLLLVPILVLAVIGFGAWAVLSVARGKPESANQATDGTQA